MRQAFPIKLAQSLLKYTFSSFWRDVKEPTVAVENSCSSLWQGIRRSIKVLPSSELVPITGDIFEARGLNKLDSQYWLLIRLVEIFQEKNDASEAIFWKIKELEEQRTFILNRLEPLKKKYYKQLHNLQNLLDDLTDFLSIKIKKYEQVDEILSELIT